MSIKTDSAWWQITLVIISAVVGATVASMAGWLGAEDREISVYSNSARSDLDGPEIWPESDTKRVSIHEYLIKNTGNVAFDAVQLRLSPEGGDSAYDNDFEQRLQVAGVHSSQAIPSDITVNRDRNAILVEIKEVRPSEEFEFTITNDGIADGYRVSILPSNINLVVIDEKQWRPMTF